MLKYLKKYWLWCILAPIFMLGEVAMDLIQPDMMKEIVDDGVLMGNLSVVFSVGIRMILLVILGGVCGMLCGVFANYAAQHFGNDLRKSVFDKISFIPFMIQARITRIHTVKLELSVKSVQSVPY